MMDVGKGVDWNVKRGDWEWRQVGKEKSGIRDWVGLRKIMTGNQVGK